VTYSSIFILSNLNFDWSAWNCYLFALVMPWYFFFIESQISLEVSLQIMVSKIDRSINWNDNFLSWNLSIIALIFSFFAYLILLIRMVVQLFLEKHTSMIIISIKLRNDGFNKIIGSHDNFLFKKNLGSIIKG
jgi:hypothetical protein